MKYLLLFALFPPFSGSAQTSNKGYLTEQRQLMRRLGLSEVRVKAYKTDSLGKLIESEIKPERWEIYDSKLRLVKEGFTSGTKNVRTNEYFYSKSGKYLGEKQYSIEGELNFGRKFSYDSKDSLVEIRNQKNQAPIRRYEYIRINDSTTLFQEYGAVADSIILSKLIIRSPLKKTTYLKINEKLVFEKEQVFDTYGREVSLLEQGKYKQTACSRVYDSSGKLVSEEFIETPGEYHTESSKRKVIYSYNDSEQLILKEVYVNDHISWREAYTFTGNQLVQQKNTNFYKGLVSKGEEIVVNYTYHPNGLIKSVVLVPDALQQTTENVVTVYSYR